MNRSKKLLILHLFILLAVSAYLILAGSFGCPIRSLTGIPCPACGMTRAFASIANLDFARSFAAHPLLLPVLALVFAGMHRNTKIMRFFSKKVLDAVLAVGAALFFAVYLLRLYFSAIP